MDVDIKTGTTFGRYHIESELAKGAMGTVFKARDVALDRPVALKVMSTSIATSPDEEAEFHARFEREARIAAKLQHPSIVQVHDVGNDVSRRFAFMALEFVEGETLKERLDREGKLPLPDAVAIASRVLRALHFAHQAGVVHRDVKPSNVLLGRDGSVKLTDFGIARISGSDLTRTGVHVGTPNFMSPEQVKGRTADARSDLFALAITVYWMITGTRPFGADDPARVAYRTVNVLPVPPHEIRHEMPIALSRAVLRGLEKDPAKRFQSGEEFARALEDALAPRAEAAPPPSQETIQVTLPAEVAAAVDPPPAGKGGGNAVIVAVVALFLAFVAFAVFLRFSERPTVSPKTVPATPDLHEAWDLGVDYFRSGRLDEAKHQFDLVLEYEPANQNARAYLALLMEAQSKRESVEAAGTPAATGTPEGEAIAPATPSETAAAPSPGTSATAPPTPPPAPEATGSVAPATPAPTAPSPTPTPTRKPPAAPLLPALPTPPPKPGTLALTISHRMESGTLEVFADRASIGRVPLQGKEKPFRGPRGDTQTTLPIPLGKHVLQFRLVGVRDGITVKGEHTVASANVTKEAPLPINVTIAKDGSITAVAGASGPVKEP